MRSITRWTAAAMFLLSAGLARNVSAQVCTNGPLPEVSAAIIPANGFPLYYVDANGLALQPCLNLAGCGALAATLPNPLLPISFPANFPVEAFYARAVAKFAVGTVTGIYTAALEGTFLNGVVATGNQMVFTRVRVRVDGLQPGGVYTVTHPYGVKTFTADGFGVINDTVTVGAVPISLSPTAFSLALAGPVGSTFLTWDAPAPAGFIGDAATPHTVTGSPCGTNFFQVEGPGLAVGGVQTNLFVITGQTIDVCGNGILDAGEDCDDGNKLAGDCCSPTCKFEPLGSPCTAPTICTNNACNGAGVCGSVSLNDGLACTDGNVCTVADTCTGGACLGTPKNCVDGNPCTTDLCTPPAVGCENINNGILCDDGNPATTGDSCSGGVCMGFTRDAKLGLAAGENPSLAGFPAVGDARSDGSSVRVSLTNLDPARYPAGCAGAAIKVGGISGTASVTPFAAQAAPLVRATAVNFKVAGTVAAGSAVDFRLSCTVGGVLHQTRWAGTVANVAVPCTPTTCVAQGKNCGTIPDGCGGTLTCGVCIAPNTCGGGGVANVCGVGAPPPPPPATALLTLTATGRAGETVSSTPAGLSVSVGATGSASFPVGTSITLRDVNGRSVIWSGVCTSGGVKTASCTFTLNAASSETANVQ